MVAQTKQLDALFSYGTLQQKQVQLDTFGRELTGKSDSLSGFVVSEVEIKDQQVIASSGTNMHPILIPSKQNHEPIEGTVFFVSNDELNQADEYEVDDYRRIKVTLDSGTEAWIYAAAEND